VRWITCINDKPNLKTRNVLSGGTPSHQLGYYEMRTQHSTGKRRSCFKVLVNLDEHENPQQALSAWSEEVERLQEVGREKRVEWLQRKLDRLQDLTEGGDDELGLTPPKDTIDATSEEVRTITK
jgi:hypothetical protein